MTEIKPGAKVRAAMRGDGHVVRLERRNRQNGAIVQWPGRQYADWYPLVLLQLVAPAEPTA